MNVLNLVEIEIAKHSDATALLKKAISLAEQNTDFSDQLTNAFDAGSTTELRELFSKFGDYFKSEESYPWYPHADAVNVIDTALHHIRLRSKQPLPDGYNCCTYGILPDLTSALSLEITAVAVVQIEDGSTHCEPLFGVASGVEEPDPDYEDVMVYTVYFRDTEGFAEALHDCDTLEDAKAIAQGIMGQYQHLTLTLN